MDPGFYKGLDVSPPGRDVLEKYNLVYYGGDWFVHPGAAFIVLLVYIGVWLHGNR